MALEISEFRGISSAALDGVTGGDSSAMQVATLPSIADNTLFTATLQTLALNAQTNLIQVVATTAAVRVKIDGNATSTVGTYCPVGVPMYFGIKRLPTAGFNDGGVELAISLTAINSA